MDSVKTQYLDPLIWGMVDPDKGYQEFMEKMKQAGLEKVKEEFKRQWVEYLKSKE